VTSWEETIKSILKHERDDGTHIDGFEDQTLSQFMLVKRPYLSVAQQ